MATDFWAPLRSRLDGDLSDSQGVRGAYATDASVYQQFPRAVVFPKHHGDVVALVEFASKQGISLIGRGAGTSLSGQAIGPGLVVDFSRYMNRVVAVDPQSRLATVEPGAVLDEVNQQLVTHRLHFAPDPATASRATMGGMIGNNACGTRSIIYGRTCDAVESLRTVLADGSTLATRWLDAAGWIAAQNESERHSNLYREVDRLIAAAATEIRQRVPDLPRIAAGYSVARLLDRGNPRSLSDLIVGGEGTLGLVTQATIRLQPFPAATRLLVSAFASIDAALEALPLVLSHQPAAAELLDEVLLREASQNAATRHLVRSIIPAGDIPNAVLLIEFFSDSDDGAQSAAIACRDSLTRQAGGSRHHLLQSAIEQRAAWDVRRLGLGLISNLAGKRKSIALIEDACLPIEALPEYNRFVFDLGARLNLGVSTYGHASVGVLHYKVLLDLHQTEDRGKMREMAEACFERCCQLGGVFSGEHGDGIVRAEFLERQFGSQIYRLFVALKQLFDPQCIFNPGRKIDAPPLDRLLRYGDRDDDRRHYLQVVERQTSQFRYANQGGLVAAIEQCNGVGACRQTLKGTMCPSYRATFDEVHSTRGRANMLRLAISGQLDPPGLANPELHQALDLCLACKACKSECPNAVDLAKLKGEALHAKWQVEGASRSASFFAQMAARLKSMQRFSALTNWGSGLAVARAVLQRRYGIDRRRALPKLAKSSFDSWWRRQAVVADPAGPLVALFVDAWNRYLEPEIGIAAVQLLRGLGYRVEIPAACDALRSRLSVGLLTETKKLAGALHREFDRYLQRGAPIVCIEPSEASALADDLADLADDRALAERVAQSTHLIDDFLADAIAAGTAAVQPVEAHAGKTALIHPHCHQRALFDPRSTQAILQAAGYRAELADLGCCGMAGSFGYTHYEVSRQIAELKFLPALRAARTADTLVIATGTSCRQQARDLAGINPIHWLDLIAPRVGA